MPPTHRVHCIVKQGGESPDIIPAQARLNIAYRTLNVADQKRLGELVEQCCESAARTVPGCRLATKWLTDISYDAMLHNRPIADAFSRWHRRAGADYRWPSPQVGGSTDMGCISQRRPSIHPKFYIGTDAAQHTSAFAEASGSVDAQPLALQAAIGLAMSALELFSSSDLRRSADEAFHADKKSS